MLQKKINQHSYEVVSQSCDLPLDLSEIKTHLGITVADETENEYISNIARAAIQFAEKMLNIAFLTSTYRLHIDNFCDICIPIRRRPNVAITSIKYFKETVLTTVDALTYYLTFSNNYPTVQPFNGQEWPSDLDCRKQAVQINFTAGYGASFESVPQNLKLALYNHIAAIYANRGDCSDNGCSAGACASCLPATTKQVYDSCKIINIGVC